METQTVKERLVIEHSWKFAVPTMNRPDFLSSLLGFDKDRVNDEDVELLFPYLAAEDFTYEAAKKASGNVAGLCVWIKAMKTYTEIAKVVKQHPSPSPSPSPGQVGACVVSPAKKIVGIGYARIRVSAGARAPNPYPDPDPPSP